MRSRWKRSRQDVYNDRLKLLGQQGKLPIFIEGGDTTWIQDVVIPNNLFYDLKGFVDEHPEIKELIGEDAYNYNLHDGKLVTLMTPVVSPITMFYNEASGNPASRSPKCPGMTLRRIWVMQKSAL